MPAAVLLVLDSAALVLLAFMHVVNRATAHSRLFDMDQENNLPTWLSTTNFALAAAACALAAATFRGRARVALATVALLALAFSIDESASLHEVAGRELGAQTTLSLTQPLAGLAVAAVLLVAAHQVLVARGLLMAAAAMLVLSQACASVAGLWTSGGLLFALEAVEDTTETLVGITLLAAGLAAGGARLDLRPAAVREEWRRWTSGLDDRDERPVMGNS